MHHACKMTQFLLYCVLQAGIVKKEHIKIHGFWATVGSIASPACKAAIYPGWSISRLCKSRPTPVRSTIHIKPSHLSACMLVTIVAKPVRGSVVRWLASLSEGWINVISLCCVSDAYYWTCFTQLLLPCFLQSFMPRLIKMATRELSVLFGPQKLILVALVCRVFSGFCFLVASFLWLSEWMFSGL